MLYIITIGTIEKQEQDFEKYIQNCFEKNPHLKDKIIFTGNVCNKNELNNWYVKAKVFVLPSRYEVFALAPIEAASFMNYLILTDVGAARDLIPTESYDYILPESKQDKQNEELIKEKLTEKLNHIISGTDKTDLNIEERYEFYKSFLMEYIVRQDCFVTFIN